MEDIVLSPLIRDGSSMGNLVCSFVVSSRYVFIREIVKKMV